MVDGHDSCTLIPFRHCIAIKIGVHLKPHNYIDYEISNKQQKPTLSHGVVYDIAIHSDVRSGHEQSYSG